MRNPLLHDGPIALSVFVIMANTAAAGTVQVGFSPEGSAQQLVLEMINSAQSSLRTGGDFRIQHDKVIVVDNKSVKTGSYNKTASEAENNSENALLIEDAPELAAQYLTHGEDRWQRGRDWKTAY